MPDQHIRPFNVTCIQQGVQLFSVLLRIAWLWPKITPAPGRLERITRFDPAWDATWDAILRARYELSAKLRLIVAISSAAVLSAQAKTDEDYDKLMKGVGAARGAR